VLPDAQHRAQGGPAQAGQPLIVGDGGRAEVFVPQSDGYVYPSLDEGRQAVAGSGAGASAGVTVNFYGTQYPSVEQLAALHRELAVAVGTI
jgi:hypothetical protein